MLKNKLHGFTMIELIVVMMIVGIIAGISAKIIGAGFIGYLNTRQLTSADGQVRLALERMQRDIRAIRSSADITTATATSLAFNNTAGNLITYSVSGTTLMLQVGANTAQPLASGLGSSSIFTYYDRNFATSPATANIRYVLFNLNITLNNTNFSASSAVYPRNLE